VAHRFFGDQAKGAGAISAPTLCPQRDVPASEIVQKLPPLWRDLDIKDPAAGFIAPGLAGLSHHFLA
jgi:hypothetical protein